MIALVEKGFFIIIYCLSVGVYLFLYSLCFYKKKKNIDDKAFMKDMLPCAISVIIIIAIYSLKPIISQIAFSISFICLTIIHFVVYLIFIIKIIKELKTIKKESNDEERKD